MGVGTGLTPRAATLVGGLLLIALVVQMGIAALRDSVTIDEFVGLPVGLYALQGVDFRSQSMNPPFFRSIAALPLRLGWGPAPEIPRLKEKNDWAIGYQFMFDNARVYQQLFVPPRCMVILATTLLGALVWQWATELYGWPAGLVALFLFSFCPTILANGHLLTLDLAGAIGWVGAGYLTWRLLDRQTISRTIALGLMLGLAPALKLSGVIVPILIVILVLVRGTTERNVSWYRWLGLLLVVELLAIAVLNGLYRFEGFATPLASIPLQSGKMRALARALPWLRLPLPTPFLDSLDVLLLGDQPTEPSYFLAGSWSMTGWRYYHLVAFVLKTPLPLLASALFAITAWLAGHRRGLRDYCVILPVVLVLAANSWLNPLNIGVRHALPVYPLLAIAAAPWLAAPLERFVAGARTSSDAARAAVSLALLGWFLAASLSVAPRYLEYFNELAGGPRGGHRWLIDSNLDWGQDLIRLSDYMRQRDLRSVHLAYFGRVDPTVYGVAFTPLVEGESHGTAVVSASFLMGRPYWIWRSPGDLLWSRAGAFTWLQRYRPVARVGSMFVFELP